jgi:hypothetical protein
MSTFRPEQLRQPLSLSGSFTGSLLGTASYADFAGNGGGGGGTPGGSDTQIQYNNGGAFGGSPNFTFSGSSTVRITGSLIVSGSGTFKNIGPAEFTGSVNSLNGYTGSLFGTASFATNALTASSADAFTVRGNATINGTTTLNSTASLNGPTTLGGATTATSTFDVKNSGTIPTLNLSTANNFVGQFLFATAKNAIDMSTNYVAETTGIYIIALANETNTDFKLPPVDMTGITVIVNTDTVRFQQIIPSQGSGARIYDRGSGNTRSDILAGEMLFVFSDGTNYYTGYMFTI